MTTHGFLRIGLNARLFPGVWRPVRDEVAFAAKEGFDAIQFPGLEHGLDAECLGCSLEETGEALRASGLTAVMEIVVRVGEDGRTAGGRTPFDVLEANRPAIVALSCTRVHWHLVPLFAAAEFSSFENSFVPQFRSAVELGKESNFLFGLEHNEPDIGLFATPSACASMLNSVPDLGFVWDLNHTIPEHLADFLELAHRMSLLHISDTPLPAVNHHLPIGKGAIDFRYYFGELGRRGFDGVGILEIGGLPKSGGYGQDTDAALRESKTRLDEALRPILEETGR